MRRPNGNRQGIVFANEERLHGAPLNRNGNNFIELMELGQGNGGAVFKALHLPSMKVSQSVSQSISQRARLGSTRSVRHFFFPVIPAATHAHTHTPP